MLKTAFRTLLLAPLCALFVSASPAAAAPRSHVLLITQKDGPNAPVDARIAAHLGTLGYDVQIVNQDANPSSVHDIDLIVMSSTVSAKDVNPGWRTVAIPLLTWENDFLDDLAMTGKRHDADFGEVEKERYLWIVNAPHPMAGGLPAGIANVFVKQAGMSWGKPGLGATTIATIYGQPEKAAIFGYEKGATMDYESLAPARRVMMFLGNDSFTNLSPTGMILFDSAIAWAIRLPARPATRSQ